MATSKRKQPNLGPAGKALTDSIRRELGEDFELDEREEAMLDLAARQADDVARLEADIAERGTTVKGSTGQPVLNPAISEARQSRLALAKILGGLELPDSERESVGRARAAAAKRWKGASR